MHFIDIFSYFIDILRITTQDEPQIISIMKSNSNTYSNKEITVSFDPKCCEHSGKCLRQLSEVFRSSVIPWIDLEAAETEKIISQIKKCPSGALSYVVHNKDVA